MTINDLKIDMISVISSINDIELLRLMNDNITKVNASFSKRDTLDFNAAITAIRNGVSADDIFNEQGNKHITFHEIKEITGDLEWEVSLTEMLASLH